MRDCLDAEHIEHLTPSMRVTLLEASANYRSHRAEASDLPASTSESNDASFLGWKPEEFDGAVASAQQVIVWYECVARLGFGVHAWY